jgi:hypothetical protein
MQDESDDRTLTISVTKKMDTFKREREREREITSRRRIFNLLRPTSIVERRKNSERIKARKHALDAFSHASKTTEIRPVG